MTTEEGTVTKTDVTIAWVKVKKTEACESCSVRGSCHVLGGGKEMEVQVLNTIGAKVDDRVVLSFETSSLLKATFLIYVVPIIFLISGAVIGQTAASLLNFNPSICSAILALLCFSLSILYVKAKGNELSTKNSYQPQISRIIR